MLTPWLHCNCSLPFIGKTRGGEIARKKWIPIPAAYQKQASDPGAPRLGGGGGGGSVRVSWAKSPSSSLLLDIWKNEVTSRGTPCGLTNEGGDSDSCYLFRISITIKMSCFFIRLDRVRLILWSSPFQVGQAIVQCWPPPSHHNHCNNCNQTVWWQRDFELGTILPLLVQRTKICLSIYRCVPFL